MGPEGAVNILYKRELDKAADPQARGAPRRVAEFREKFAEPVRRRRARASSTK
jgi:propionyl-CoA carboxylase beta chain